METGPAQDSRVATPLAELAGQLRTVAQRIESLFRRQFDTIGLHLNDNQNEYRRQEAQFSQLMVDKAVSDQGHTEYAEKVISLADAYEQGFIRSLQSLNDEISNELIDFEQLLDRVSERTALSNHLASLRRWLSLSQELQTARIMATRGIIDQVIFDKRIPKMIVDRQGCVDITLFRDRSKEFSDGLATYTSFIKQSFADHQRIQPEREQLYQELLACDLENAAVGQACIVGPQQRVRSINPLEAKSWFRRVKVVYIGLWIVGMGAVVLVAIALQNRSVLVFGCLATSALLIGLKKAFYYVIFGTTTAVERPGAGFVDIEDLNRDLFRIQADHPVLYREVSAPNLESWKTEYGRRVRPEAVKLIDGRIDQKLGPIRREKQQLVNRPTIKGATIEISELRKRLEASKNAYRGADKQQYLRALDRWLMTLETKYGRAIPLDEASRILDNLDSDIRSDEERS